MKLIIHNWRSAWRMLSVQAAAAAVAFGLLPETQQAAILDLVGVDPERIPALLGLAFIGTRLISQPRLPA